MRANIIIADECKEQLPKVQLCCMRKVPEKSTHAVLMLFSGISFFFSVPLFLTMLMYMMDAESFEEKINF